MHFCLLEVFIFKYICQYSVITLYFAKMDYYNILFEKFIFIRYLILEY